MSDAAIERQTMDVDIVCVGFGPATAGFLATLAPHMVNADGTPAIESPSTPGLPLQVMCYERADDIGFGVSGVVTRARGIRATLPDLEARPRFPMAAPVRQEKVVYLLDPVGASRRSPALQAADRAAARRCAWRPRVRDRAAVCAAVPRTRHGGLVISLGQFMQYVGSELMASGTVQIWPGMPVAEALVEERAGACAGVRLLDQGVDRDGHPDAGYMPGMDMRAALTVVGDGPVGAVGRQLDARVRPAAGHHQREWALGMKMVVDLPGGCRSRAGHRLSTPSAIPSRKSSASSTCMPDRVATVGIFVPSWFRSPMRTSYRYLQHFMLHPYLWRYLQGRQAALLGRQVVAGIGQARRAASGGQRATRASARARAAPTCSPAPAWTKPGPPARNWPKPWWSCCGAASRSTSENLEADLRGAAPRKLGGRGRPRRREGARRLPSRA